MIGAFILVSRHNKSRPAKLSLIREESQKIRNLVPPNQSLQSGLDIAAFGQKRESKRRSVFAWVKSLRCDWNSEKTTTALLGLIAAMIGALAIIPPSVGLYSEWMHRNREKEIRTKQLLAEAAQNLIKEDGGYFWDVYHTKEKIRESEQKILDAADIAWKPPLKSLIDNVLKVLPFVDPEPAPYGGDHPYFAFAEGIRFIALRSSRSAEKPLRLFCDQFPNHGQSRLALGFCLLRSDQLSEALNEYELVSDRSEFDQARFGIGRCYVGSGEFQKAYDTFRTLAVKYPDDPTINSCLSAVLFNLGYEAKAKAIIKEGLLRHPNNLHLLARLGESYWAEGWIQESYLILKELPLAELYSEIQAIYLKCLFELGRAQEAMEASKVIRVDFPNDRSLAEFQAKLFQCSGKIDEATYLRNSIPNLDQNAVQSFQSLNDLSTLTFNSRSLGEEEARLIRSSIPELNFGKERR